MTAIAQLFIAAVIVEALVQAIKMGFGHVTPKWEVVTAFALGILLAVVYRLDLMAAVGLATPIPYVGNLLTGLLFGRGANAFFDLVGRLSEIGGPRQS